MHLRHLSISIYGHEAVAAQILGLQFTLRIQKLKWKMNTN